MVQGAPDPGGVACGGRIRVQWRVTAGIRGRAAARIRGRGACGGGDGAGKGGSGDGAGDREGARVVRGRRMRACAWVGAPGGRERGNQTSFELRIFGQSDRH